MKYIIKGNKIFGIYSNNYQNLTGKPLINNVELAEGKSYSSSDLNIIKHMTKAEYEDPTTTKDPNCYYVVSTETVADLSNFDYLNIDNKPSINNVTLTGNKSLLDLNLYSIDEIDNKIASSRSVKVQSTKPTSADVLANTLYYIGPDSNSKYHVYLYDNNKVEADLGMSDVDLSGYQPTTNRVTTLTYTADDTTYPTTSAVFKETPQERNISASSATDVDNLVELMFKDGLSEQGSSLKAKKVSGYGGYGSIIGNALPAIANSSVSSHWGFMEAEIVKVQADNNFYGYVRIKPAFSTITVQNVKGQNYTWSGWQVVNGDAFAPLQIQRSTRSSTIDSGISLDSDTCIWNMKNTGLGTNFRVTEKKIFSNAYLVDPIGNKWIWGTLEVLQISSTTTGVGLIVYQTLTASYFNDAVVSQPVIFKRMGFAPTCVDSSQIESATITWNAWIPVEYPTGISLPLNTTSVSSQGLTAWGGNANITGGMLKITYNGLIITQNATVNLAITSLSKFVLKQDYAIGFLSGIDNNKNCYLWASKGGDLLANKMEINVRYYGQIMIPLGY